MIWKLNEGIDGKYIDSIKNQEVKLENTKNFE